VLIVIDFEFRSGEQEMAELSDLLSAMMQRLEESIERAYRLEERALVQRFAELLASEPAGEHPSAQPERDQRLTQPDPSETSE
jgi:hypothetical protein